MTRYYRKVIRITADDSPNVRYARKEIAEGLEPTGRMLIPGVLPWSDYQKRRATWDKVRQTIGLDAEFYEGHEVFLFPKEWLLRSAQLAIDLESKKRTAKAMGIDVAEGGDDTVWTIVDEFGVIYQESKATPDTSKITGDTIALMRRFRIPEERVLFDRGGGGKEHADRLRSMQTMEFPYGIKVRTLGFGEVVAIEPRRGLQLLETRREVIEERYVYKNRRAQMYGEASILCDMTYPCKRSQALDSPLIAGYAIPTDYAELRRQLSLIPKYTDEEGRLFLPPKQRRSGKKEQPDEITLDKILGRSPDQADSFVLAIHAMLHKGTRVTAGVA
jgi:hypothetical protein